MLRKNRKLSCNQYQFSVSNSFTELEFNTAISKIFDFDNISIIRFIKRRTFIHQCIKSEDNIIHVNCFSIVKPGFWIKMINHPGSVFRILNFIRNQAIFSKSLIGRTSCQCFVNHAQSISGNPFGDKSVETVISADGIQTYRTTFWCIRIYIVKMGEAVWIFSGTVHCNRGCFDQISPGKCCNGVACEKGCCE